MLLVTTRNLATRVLGRAPGRTAQQLVNSIYPTRLLGYAMVSVQAGMTSIFASRRSRVFINTPGSLSEHTQLLASALYGPLQGRSYSNPQFSRGPFGFKHILSSARALVGGEVVPTTVIG